ncbi:MAG: hypothetical protein ACYCYA_13610, partial [Actinomycetes bacterium]
MRAWWARLLGLGRGCRQVLGRGGSERGSERGSAWWGSHRFGPSVATLVVLLVVAVVTIGVQALVS